MVGVENVVPLLGAEYDGDGVVAEIVGPMLVAEGAGLPALLRDLAQADGHLRGAQREDRDGEEGGLLAHDIL